MSEKKNTDKDIKYTICTLDAAKLVRNYERLNGRFDLNDTYIRKSILKSGGLHSGCALFDQIMFSREKVYQQKAEPQDLTRDLLYLDFGYGISGIEEETRQLIENGFELKYQDSSDYIKYCPFEKSASMSRNNVISFINEALFEEVDRRLGLDIDWTSIRLKPAKYYAYRGLYMTDGVRIELADDRADKTDSNQAGCELQKPVLNEKTVLVLKYDEFDLQNIDAISIDQSKRKENEIEVSAENVIHKNNIRITPYDGEGLISPAYAELLRGQLKVRKGTKATSFQIRMPFTKGMLHEVDFKKFILCEFLGKTYQEFACLSRDEVNEEIRRYDLKIKDAFGIGRSLADAEIILTDSMFKSWKWLKGYVSEEDPMIYFFRKMHEYNHSLYIAGTNAVLSSGSRVRFNYQFFSTLDLDAAEFDDLVQKHIIEIKALRSDVKAAVNALVNHMTEAAEDAQDEDDINLKPPKNWEEALSLNNAFLNDPKIREEIKRVENSRTRGIMKGQIYVDGTLKYLSMDLLGMLYDIADRCGLKPPCREGESEKTVADLQSANTLHSDRFYMSPEVPYMKGGERIRLDHNAYYGILRNPHLSRNEQCALRPYISDLYNKYFGHLRGILMTGYRSEVPAALSGADFDGDMVKVVFDDAINEAILRGVYEKKGKSYIRRLPFVCIPGLEQVEKNVGRRISFEDIRDTFSSRVGQISNKAVEISRIEYDPDGEVNVPENSAALCTIATGLEIDAVKTGVSPDLSDLEKLTGRDRSGFMNAVRSFKKYSEDENINSSTLHGRYNGKTGKAEVYYRKYGDEHTVFSVDDEPRMNIDRLTRFFIGQLEEKRGQFNYQNRKDHCFEFETEEDWREKTREQYSNEIALLRPVIGAYRKLLSDTYKSERQFSEGFKYKGHVLTLLKQHYDFEIDNLAGEHIPEAADLAYAYLLNLLNLPDEADDTISRMKDSRWQFVPTYEERLAKLNGILDGEEAPDEAAVKVLCDTYDNGYLLLSYILEDTRKQINIEYDESLPPEDRYSIFRRDYDKQFYKELYKESFGSLAKATASDWKQAAGDFCRKRVSEIFDGDLRAAVKCTVALDRGNGCMDESHRFLWGVFHTEDIMSVIYRG